MEKYRILVITDHSGHQAYESLYPLLKAMRKHPRCERIDLLSRGNSANKAFFNVAETKLVQVTAVRDTFTFRKTGSHFRRNPLEVNPEDYDVIFLRLPKPNPREWFLELETRVGKERIINSPSGILETGSKPFLLNFPDLCPPMKICHTLEDVLTFREKFPIVLKPFALAGGKGLVKIDGDNVWLGNIQITLDEFLPDLINNLQNGYLAMKFLRHVDQGDKRIIVADGEITGSALRLPAEGSWLCNVNMGGYDVPTEPDEDEIYIASRIAPVLKEKGVILFGFDTLMGDEGKRVLSEINASNAGGMYPAELRSGKPVIAPTAARLWNYIEQQIIPRKRNG